MSFLQTDWFLPHYHLGLTYEAGKSEDDALKEYTAALNLNDKSSAIYARLGLLFLSQKKYSDCEKLMPTLLKSFPKHPLRSQWTYLYAAIPIFKKDWKKAIQEQKAALESERGLAPQLHGVDAEHAGQLVDLHDLLFGCSMVQRVFDVLPQSGLIEVGGRGVDRYVDQLLHFGLERPVLPRHA